MLPKKIKILFYIPTLHGGGAEKVLINMVNQMTLDTFDVTVSTEFFDPESKRLAPGVHYKTIFNEPFSKAKHFIYRITSSLKLTYSLFLKDNYDLEVAYLEFGATKVIASSTNRNAKKVAWVHCDLKRSPTATQNTSKLEKIYKRYNKVVCVSEDTKKSFDELFHGCVDSIVLHNVIDDAEIFHKASEKCDIPKKDGVVDLLASGRLIPLKRFDDLIEVAKKLSDDGLPFFLRILGDGPEKSKLQQLIDQYSLRKHVELIGYQSNPYKYMDKSDIILSTSLTEGLSTVIIESMILGKAIVAKECNGMHELLLDSVGGVITGRSNDSFYKEVRKMILDADYRNGFSKRAYNLGKNYYTVKTICDIEKFFEEIVQLG